MDEPIVKYKIRWSVFCLGEPVQRPVSVLQSRIKALTLTLAGSGYFYGDAETCLIIALAGFACDIILSCTQLEEIK